MNQGKIVIILCVILLSIQIASADMLNLTASTILRFNSCRLTAHLECGDEDPVAFCTLARVRHVMHATTMPI